MPAMPDPTIWKICGSSHAMMRVHVQAGLKGKSEYSWLFVDWLWVSPPHRNRGIGARLLGKAEEIARGRGCIGVHLGSLTFQAPDFYRRQGYEEVGRLENFPPGHALVLFKKLL